MAEKTTIARPYAKALFELAFEQKKLRTWSEVLARAAAVAADERVRRLLASPVPTTTELADFFAEIVDAGLGEQGYNFLRTLAVNRRLGLLPEIAAIFEKLKAESENTIEVIVVSAVPVEAELEREYAAVLRKRLKRDVRLRSTVDRSLLGGAVLRADDLVIDGSLRGRLQRLSAELAN